MIKGSHLLEVFQYSGRALGLVWETSSLLTIIIAGLTLIAGLLPGAIAYLGKLIVDAVIESRKMGAFHPSTPLVYVGLEAIAVVLLALSQRGLGICQSLLRSLLQQRVSSLILKKTITLELRHFEDVEFYDKLMNAKRESSYRPLSLINRIFGLIQNGLSLCTYGFLLVKFSSFALFIIILAAFPVFLAETKFAQDTFRLMRKQISEMRQQWYIEMLLTADTFAKEIQLYQLGNMLVTRHENLFTRFHKKQQNLTIKQGVWSYLLGLLSTITLYGAYTWIVWETALNRISLGDMTMYLMVFRQGQSTVSSNLTAIGGLYEDNLYIANLYQFLETKVTPALGNAIQGTNPEDGIRFEDVCFYYPDSTTLALKNISLHLKPGEKLAIVGGNGSGKTTLIKLLTRLYIPTSGRILLDGLDLQVWDLNCLRGRIGVIFQDFVEYHFTVGENIGIGDVERIDVAEEWESAAQKGMASPFIAGLPDGFHTQLGKWFKGQELSGGQWQKIALSRAFMRSNADILVLDEPTSAIDPQAEFDIFNHFLTRTERQMVFLISHRFSTVRMADKIVLLELGEIIEQGTHEELLQAGGRYASLFSLQAAGYQ